MLCWPLDSQLDELSHLKVAGNIKLLKSLRELVKRIANILKNAPETNHTHTCPLLPCAAYTPVVAVSKDVLLCQCIGQYVVSFR